MKKKIEDELHKYDKNLPLTFMGPASSRIITDPSMQDANESPLMSVIGTTAAIIFIAILIAHGVFAG